MQIDERDELLALYYDKHSIHSNIGNHSLKGFY